MIIGLLTNYNNEEKEDQKKKHRIKNNSNYNNDSNSDNKEKIDDKNHTIIYEKDMFNINNTNKSDSKEKLIAEEQYKIIRTEISEYHLIESKYNNFNRKTKIVKNYKSFLKIFLNNYPITKICFKQKEYKLMSPKIWYEKLSLNLLFYLGLFSILTSINCICFNDNLVTLIFDAPSHTLSFKEYFINSCMAGAIYIAIGIIFSLIFIYGIQGFYPGQVYESKVYKSKINGKVRLYLIGIIIFQILSILFVIFGWYYSSIFCNIYNKSQKYLVIQIIFSLLIEAIFYIIFSAFILLFKK